MSRAMHNTILAAAILAIFALIIFTMPKPAHTPPTTWERIAIPYPASTGHCSHLFYRAPVPGGWLVQDPYYPSLVYIPDPQHTWPAPHLYPNSPESELMTP